MRRECNGSDIMLRNTSSFNGGEPSDSSNREQTAEWVDPSLQFVKPVQLQAVKASEFRRC